jgi:iron complex outermembrane receptor protein
LDEEPPILGNEAGDTSSNSGNTFPSNYDVYGRYYSLSARLTL